MADSVLPEVSADVCAKKDGVVSRSRAVDLTGEKFGLLTVIDRAPNEVRCSGKMRSVWNCLCDCGGTKTVAAEHLRTGAVKSCGCTKVGGCGKHLQPTLPTYRHGMSCSAEYRSWYGAKSRTSNKSDRAYHRYGGRGITMSEAWENDFMVFLNDMGPRPPGTTLERIDNDGNYERGNCRWATPVQQARNRRSTVLYRIGYDEKTLTEWSRVSGVPEPRIWKRINLLGWSPERAIFEPVLTTWSSRPER